MNTMKIMINQFLKKNIGIFLKPLHVLLLWILYYHIQRQIPMFETWNSSNTQVWDHVWPRNDRSENVFKAMPRKTAPNVAFLPPSTDNILVQNNFLGRIWKMSSGHVDRCKLLLKQINGPWHLGWGQSALNPPLSLYKPSHTGVREFWTSWK